MFQGRFFPFRRPLPLAVALCTFVAPGVDGQSAPPAHATHSATLPLQAAPSVPTLPFQSARSLSAFAFPAPVALSAFGASVAVVDGQVFVGRPGDVALFPMPANRPGGVHVFGRDEGSWSETAAVGPAGDDIGTGYGESVDIAGELMVVGAPREGGGAVYVYRRVGGEWTSEQRLTQDVAEAGARFGAAVATNGEEIVVGAPGASDHGGAFFYELGESGWEESSSRFSAGEGGSAFGVALDMEGETVAVGAPGDDPSLLPGGGPPNFVPGYVQIIRKEGGSWSLGAKLTSGNGGLGRAVVLSSGTVFAGAPWAQGATGAVYHFAEVDGEWAVAHTIQPEMPGPGSGFGMALDADDGDLVVGAPLAGGIGAGFAFRRNEAGEWDQVAAFGPGGPFSFYGMAMAVGGDVAVAGAPGADLLEGMGFIFRRTADGWEPDGSVVDETEGPEPVTGAERECEEGSVAGFSCGDVDLVAYLPVDALGGGRGIIANDLWGWTDPETGREYVIQGRNDGTAFVDISDPSNPVFLGDLPLTEGAVPNMWRDVKVFANHAFIVADNAGPHGMQVFDLTRLRDVSSPPVAFDADAHYDGIASAHNIVLNEGTGFAYAVGASGGGETCGGGLHMIDVRDPTNPTFAGCFSDPETGHAGTGYSHDAQCIRYHGPDPDYQDREICLGANENALSIADVTDKEATVVLASASYPNTAYLHQGWVTDDHRYFFMNDELDELSGAVSRTRTLIWDISDLEEPVLVKEHFGVTGSSDHNLYVRGDFMYQANYVSGLRILDISNPEEPEEVGFFDTVPAGDDVPGFAGAWSVYPYFESGVIVVSSIREGLFLLRKKPPPVS